MMMNGGIAGTTGGGEGSTPGVCEDRPPSGPLPPVPVGDGLGEWPCECRAPDQVAYLIPTRMVRVGLEREMWWGHHASEFGGSPWVPQSYPIESEGYQGPLSDQLAQKFMFRYGAVSPEMDKIFPEITKRATGRPG